LNKPHKARKRFGQNFLHDSQGAITEPLLASKCQLDVVELDRDLVTRLAVRFEQHERFNLHSADALSFDFASLAGDEKLRVVGNLPYNISTPLLFHLIQQSSHIQDMYFMLQKEIVNRLQAKPGSKQFGRLSIMIQLHCEVEALFDVEPECFDPKPKVMSSIVRLTPHTSPKYDIHDINLFEKMVKAAFAQRRKTIRNNLKEFCDEQVLEAAGIKPATRAEAICIEQFVQLSNLISQHA